MHSSLEIVTPAACMDLTILATAKEELGIAQVDTSHDTRVATLIKQASGIVADYCNQVFGAEEVRETFWVDAPSEYVRSFMLARDHVTEIMSVIIDGQLLDPSNYRMASDGHLHRLDTVGMSMWILTSTAVIDYKAGYVLLDDLPYGIERAALSLIKSMHFSTGSDPNIRSEDIPGLRTVTYQSGNSSSSNTGVITVEAAALLKLYRRLVFA